MAKKVAVKSPSADAVKLADFFGKQIEANDGKQIAWAQAIEDEVKIYRGKKRGDLHPISLKLDSDLADMVRDAAKILKRGWGLNQWQCEGMILCLCLKFAYGRISG
jgi:hypothetical protein